MNPKGLFISLAMISGINLLNFVLFKAICKRPIMLKKIIIGIVLLTVLAIGTKKCFIYIETTPTLLDQPKKLSGQIEVIEVGYVNWACDCADFYETKLYIRNAEYILKAEDCFFIEPMDIVYKIPKSYFDTLYKTQNLKLIGQFYKEKGIPRSYEMKTDRKPDYTKVFRYSSYEYLPKKDIH